MYHSFPFSKHIHIYRYIMLFSQPRCQHGWQIWISLYTIPHAFNRYIRQMMWRLASSKRWETQIDNVKKYLPQLIRRLSWSLCVWYTPRKDTVTKIWTLITRTRVRADEHRASCQNADLFFARYSFCVAGPPVHHSPSSPNVFAPLSPTASCHVSPLLTHHPGSLPMCVLFLCATATLARRIIAHGNFASAPERINTHASREHINLNN